MSPAVGAAGPPTACSPASDPLVMASAMANTMRPSTWWRATSRGPPTPKVNRRLAAVLPIAVSSSATRFAGCAPTTHVQHQEQHQVGRGRQHPTVPNRTTWRSSDAGAADRRDGPSCAAMVFTGIGAVGEPAQQPADALEVGGGGGHDVDPAVRVVDPVHRDLVDAQAAAFGEHQQFGVEEPAGVGDVGQQFARRRRRGWP